MAEASATLRALPGDLLERIAVRVLAERAVPRVIAAGPSLARAVLGPGSLAAQGDAYRLAATRLGLTRTPHSPSWRALVAALRMEWRSLSTSSRAEPLSTRTFEGLCIQGFTLLARVSLAAGADVEQLFENSGSPLILACGNRHVALVELLLECKADVNAHKPVQPLHTTALGSASSHGFADVVALLLAARARVDLPGAYGYKPLALAVRNGNLDVVRLLLAAKADVHARADGLSALMFAGVTGNVGVIKALLRAKADVNAQTPSYRTALTETCRHSGKVPAVKALLAAGARVNVVVDQLPWPGFVATQPLHGALLNHRWLDGPAAVVKILLDANADVETRCQDTRTPLMLAAELECASGARETIHALVEAGADPFAIDGRGKTARQLAETALGYGAGLGTADALRYAERRWLHDATQATGGPGPSGV